MHPWCVVSDEFLAAGLKWYRRDQWMPCTVTLVGNWRSIQTAKSLADVTCPFSCSPAMQHPSKRMSPSSLYTASPLNATVPKVSSLPGVLGPRARDALDFDHTFTQDGAVFGETALLNCAALDDPDFGFLQGEWFTIVVTISIKHPRQRPLRSLESLDDLECVVCLSNSQTSGFVHGNTYGYTRDVEEVSLKAIGLDRIDVSVLSAHDC